jgi:hypothetical protein
MKGPTAPPVIKRIVTYAAGIVFVSAPAMAQDDIAFIADYIPSRPEAFDFTTYVRMHAPTKPGAVATITFANRSMNADRHNGWYEIRWDKIEAAVHFTYTEGDDYIEVTVPDGYVAHPKRLDVKEDHMGEVHIFKVGEAA